MLFDVLPGSMQDMEQIGRRYEISVSGHPVSSTSTKVVLISQCLPCIVTASDDRWAAFSQLGWQHGDRPSHDNSDEAYVSRVPHVGTGMG